MQIGQQPPRNEGSTGQHFSVVDSVCEKIPFATASREQGIVTKRYAFEGQYRCVVKFESGREDVFFEKELIADQTT